MIKRILKRIKLERHIAILLKTRPPALCTIIRLEWFKFGLRRRAVNAAVRAAL